MEFYTPEVTTLTKNDLVGALVIITTKTYNGEFPGSFGITEKWVGDVTVVDGPLAGKEYKDSSFLGLLAQQLSAIPAGKTGLARITSGRTRTGNTWIGADFGVTPEDVAAAQKAADKPAF